MRHTVTTWIDRFLHHVPTGHELEQLTIDFYSERAFTTRSPDIKVAAALSIACGLAAFASTPYFSKVNPEQLQQAGVTIGLLAVSQAFQAALLTVLLAFAGIALGHQLGLGTPLLQRWLNGRRVVRWDRSWPIDSALLGVLVGAGAALLTVLVHRWFPGAFANFYAERPASIIETFFACIYSSISSEVQLRLFCVTLLVWLSTRTVDRASHPGPYWFAIAVAAFVPGLGEVLLTEDTADPSYTVVSALVPNAVTGIMFGWIYWKRGLEMAILAHFFAECISRIVFPLLARWLV